MVTLIHSSDWHLGKSLFAKSLLADQQIALDELSERLASIRPQALLLAGDIFDRSVPPEEAVGLLDRFLMTVAHLHGIPVAIIPGNHDSSTRLGLHSDLLRKSGVHIFSSLSQLRQPLRVTNAGVEVAIYGIPYLEPNQWGFELRAEGGEQNPKTQDEALAALLEYLRPSLEADRQAGRRCVLLLHAFVQGGLATDSERPLAIGGSESVALEALKDFDYVALGHLHRPQKISDPRVCYPGSLFPYSASEAGQVKGVSHVNLGAKREDDVFTFLPFSKSRGLTVLKGSFADMLVAPPTEHYVVAMLRESTLPFEVFRRLSQRFPQLLHVGRETEFDADMAKRRDLEARPNQRLRSQLSDEEQLGEFLSKTELSDAVDAGDRAWLLSTWRRFAQGEP